MARKAETGIDYFPMNADIVHNPKIKLVVAEFGPRAWAVLLPIYCKIYREKGYWVDWCDEDSKLLFAQDDCKLEMSFVNEVVNGCIRRSLFDKRVFDMFGVLTSDRIQVNYIEATKRRKIVEIIGEFLCVSEDDVNKLNENVNIIDLNVNIITKKVSISTQSKRRRRVEEEGDSAGAQKHPPDVQQKFKLFEEWIKAKATNVSKMKEPFTIDQYVQLKEKYTQQQVQELILKMHNYKKLLTNNVSAYLTFINWSKKDFNDTGNGPQSEKPSINDALKAAGKTPSAVS